MTNLPAIPAPIPDVVVPTAAPNTAIVVSGALQQRVMTLVERMVQLPEITDNASLQSVREVVKTASRLKQEIEASRMLANRPFMQVIEAINKAAKEVAAHLEAVVTEGKQQETHFLIERDRQIAIEAQRLREQEAAAQLDTSRPTAPLPMMQLAEKVDAPVSTRPDIEIVDAKLIPEEFKEVNMVKLRQAVLRENREVPGVKKITVRQVVAR